MNEINLRTAQRHIPPFEQNGENKSAHSNEIEMASLAAQILQPDEIPSYLKKLQAKSPVWYEEQNMIEDAELLFRSLQEAPLQKDQRKDWKLVEIFHILKRTINTKDFLETNLTVDEGLDAAFFMSLKEITSNHCTNLPPTSRFAAQWCLMQVAIQANCLKLALNVIDAFDPPLEEHRLCGTVRGLLIAKSKEFILTIPDLNDAIAYVKKLTKICGLEAINAPINMAIYCQHQIEKKGIDKKAEFKEFLANAQWLAENLNPTENNKRDYLIPLMTLEGYDQHLI